MEHQLSVPESTIDVSLEQHFDGNLEAPLENERRQFEGTFENIQSDWSKYSAAALETIEEENEILGQTFEPPLTKRSSIEEFDNDQKNYHNFINNTQRRPIKFAPNSTTSTPAASDHRKQTKYTPNPSPRSHDTSMQSMEETILKESARCQSLKLAFAILAAEANRSEELRDVLQEVNQVSCVTQSKNSEYEINFLMLFGLLMGIVITKAFQYLVMYFACFIEQMHEYRKALWGTSTIWAFLTKCDNERISKRAQLLLLPVILVCGLLYGLITILQSMIRLLLNTAPRDLVKFVHQLQKSKEG